MTKWTRPDVFRRTEAAYAWVTPTRLAESTWRDMMKMLLMVLTLLLLLMVLMVLIMLMVLMVLMLLKVMILIEDEMGYNTAVQSDLDDLVVDPDPPVPVSCSARSDRLDEDAKLFQPCVRPHPHP